MTDLEMTKLCAEAMELIWGVGYKDIPGTEDIVWYEAGKGNGGQQAYNPLHDDAQAMALVKKFDMVIEREKDNSFGITLFTNERKGGNPAYVVRNQPDLNRAICECCARMQKAKAA